jgi:hypothetical protein
MTRIGFNLTEENTRQPGGRDTERGGAASIGSGRLPERLGPLNRNLLVAIASVALGAAEHLPYAANSVEHTIPIDAKAIDDEQGDN